MGTHLADLFHITYIKVKRRITALYSTSQVTEHNHCAHHSIVEDPDATFRDSIWWKFKHNITELHFTSGHPEL